MMISLARHQAATDPGVVKEHIGVVGAYRRNDQWYSRDGNTGPLRIEKVWVPQLLYLP